MGVGKSLSSENLISDENLPLPSSVPQKGPRAQRGKEFNLAPGPPCPGAGRRRPPPPSRRSPRIRTPPRAAAWDGGHPPARLTALLRCAPPGTTALSRPALRRHSKQSRRSPKGGSPQPSWLRPLLHGRKSAVSQTTKQTEVIGLEKWGGA